MEAIPNSAYATVPRSARRSGLSNHPPACNPGTIEQDQRSYNAARTDRDHWDEWSVCPIGDRKRTLGTSGQRD